MEKRISYDQFQSVKRVAQACNPLMVKRNKLKEKMKALTKEYCEYDTQIASLEAGIKSVLGFRVEQLIKKVIEPGIDVNGQPKKTTKYLPTDIVSYDAAKKQYVISIPENTDVPDSEAPAIEGDGDYVYTGAVADASSESSEEAASSEESVPSEETFKTHSF